ncbi:MAG TPA: DNA translocase FtsK 4TM domain-containing protein [Candidatus Acidoferrum sp.]|nr:DNA translocase FtsK 4TM domain-containing protein [Candidatus Acidoferrum sp.]
MATKSTKSGTSAKSESRQKAARTREENRRKAEFSRASTAIFQIALGILLLIAIVGGLFDKSYIGPLGELARRGITGIFGAPGVLFPAALLYAGFINAFGKRDKSYAVRKTAAILFIVVLSGFLALFAPEAEGISALYVQGYSELVSGGVVGGLLTGWLLPLVQTVGVVVIYAACALLCLVALSNLTVEKLLRALFPERQPKQQKPEAAPAPTPKPSPVPLPIPPHRGSVDIPIDGEVREPAAPATPQLPEAPTFTGIHAELEPAHTAQGAPIAEPEKIELAPGELAHETAKVQAAISKTDLPPVYRIPPLTLLAPDPGVTHSAVTEAEVRANSTKIIETLRSFGVEATLLGASRGPTVTRYEVAPAAGVKISRITNLSDDLALSLAALGVRIEAPIPGKAAIGIEVPNKNNSTVYLRSVLESAAFRKAKSPLTFALGKDIAGAPVVADISGMPHVLIAGATGSGKSVCINSLIISLLYRSSPAELRLIMVDPKVVELGGYNGIPHLLIPVVTEPRKAAGALSWAVGEMMKRYSMFAEKGVKDITGYNLLVPGDEEVTPLPRILIIIDELADLMMVAPGEVEDSIMRLAQMARAAGMHLVIATQRPTVNVITGTIKANIPTRIAFAVSSQIDSRTILDTSGADKLIGRGDMLYYPVGAPKPLRLQGCLVTDKEVETIVAAIKSQGHPEGYDSEVMTKIEEESQKNEKGKKGAADSADEAEDEMFMPAVEIAVEAGNVSASMLQRRLKLGYARAARLVDEMQDRGIVGPPDGSKPRQALISRSEWQEMVMRKSGS